MSGLILTIRLQGRVSGPKVHSNNQDVQVDVGGRDRMLSAKIKHTNREPQPCVRIMRLSEEVVKGFQGECPYWEKERNWKNLSNFKKLMSHLNRYDEGFGFTFEFLDKKEK